MKITKKELKKLIKEELETVMSEGVTLADGKMLVELAKVMQKYGLAISNGHAWVREGMEKQYITRKASDMDTGLMP